MVMDMGIMRMQAENSRVTGIVSTATTTTTEGVTPRTGITTDIRRGVETGTLQETRTTLVVDKITIEVPTEKVTKDGEDTIRRLRDFSRTQATVTNPVATH